MKAWRQMKLGDWVHCTRCIRKTGNHYEIIPAENAMDNTETALYFERGAESPVEVDGFHDCERIEFVDMQFEGVYVGTTMVCRRLECSYETPPYGKEGYRFEKYDPIEVAIVYYAQNHKRLVPLDSLRQKEA